MLRIVTILAMGLMLSGTVLAAGAVGGSIGLKSEIIDSPMAIPQEAPAGVVGVQTSEYLSCKSGCTHQDFKYHCSGDPVGTKNCTGRICRCSEIGLKDYIDWN